MNTKSSTQFAPAERASPEEIRRQSEYFGDGSALIIPIFNAAPDVLAVLNKERQIVFANRGLSALLEPGAETPTGLRPGEALKCVHAFDSERGCGTTEFCRTCGAVQAILDAQRGQAAVQECRIIRQNGEALDLRVWATPVVVQGEQFTIIAVADISHEKRRQALEHIFFHDVLNTATGLHGYATLLRHAGPDEMDVELKEMIFHLTVRLIEEIQAQRELTAAENGELIVRPIEVETQELLQELILTYSQHRVGQKRSFYIDPDAQNLPTLLLYQRSRAWPGYVQHEAAR